MNSSDKANCEIVEFNVPGDPVGKQRPRKGRGGKFYTPNKTLSYEKKIKLFAKLKWLGKEPDPESIFHLNIIVLQKRATPDIDNVLKSIMDGLQGVVYKNDSQVNSVRIRKNHNKANIPGVNVQIYFERGIKWN